MRIACLHTAAVNIGQFEDAAQALGLPPGALSHTLRADLLAAAGRAGGMTPAIADETRAALLALTAGADAVLLTCSTLGEAAAACDAAVPVLRIDAALAAQATRGGGRVVALCAAQSTLAPTARLFAAAAARSGARVETRMIPGAWARFLAGDHDGYLDAVAAAADAARDGGADVVALAQASMTGAVARAARAPAPLASPAAGLAAARDALAQEARR